MTTANPDMMKALSLWQPWATGVALGFKRFETRSWGTNYRGPLAIQGALRPMGRDETEALWREPWKSAFKPHSPGSVCPDGWGELFQGGAILVICELVDCIPVENVGDISDLERSLGDYTPGRFAFRLENVRRVIKPIPCRGRQGLFYVRGVAGVETAKVGDRWESLGENHTRVL